MAKGSEMSAAGSGNPTMKAFIGRHAEKRQDWDAFPASRGYPELARAQIRYIGAGGAWSTALISKSIRAKSSACWDRTAPEKRRRSALPAE